MNEQEARDDEREALAQVIANAFFAMQAGQEWNAEGTSYSQPVPSGGDMDLAVSILAAGYRKHPEPEWEWQSAFVNEHGDDWDEFPADSEEQARGHIRDWFANNSMPNDGSSLIVRRRVAGIAPGPWEPIA